MPTLQRKNQSAQKQQKPWKLPFRQQRLSAGSDKEQEYGSAVATTAQPCSTSLLMGGTTPASPYPYANDMTNMVIDPMQLQQQINHQQATEYQLMLNAANNAELIYQAQQYQQQQLYMLQQQNQAMAQWNLNSLLPIVSTGELGTAQHPQTILMPQPTPIAPSTINSSPGTAAANNNNFVSDNRNNASPGATSAPTNGAGGDFVYWHYNPSTELYSRKVFVGGLPIDITEHVLYETFRKYGPLSVDWPHKNVDKGFHPPKGYVFLVFENEASVRALIEQCTPDGDKFFIKMSSPTLKDKAVQVRPWRLADADFVLDASMSMDVRNVVFVGGVPRPLKAVELAHHMDRLYGGVCYAGIDVDPDVKYPKGAARVAFTSRKAFIEAISARYVQLQGQGVEGENKRLEIKPYVVDDQMCDECQGQNCALRFAPFFCPNVACLQYYCKACWARVHAQPSREAHRPLIKES